jgi:hypothetical protein
MAEPVPLGEAPLGGAPVALLVPPVPVAEVVALPPPLPPSSGRIVGPMSAVPVAEAPPVARLASEPGPAAIPVAVRTEPEIPVLTEAHPVPVPPKLPSQANKEVAAPDDDEETPSRGLSGWVGDNPLLATGLVLGVTVILVLIAALAVWKSWPGKKSGTASASPPSEPDKPARFNVPAEVTLTAGEPFKVEIDRRETRGPLTLRVLWEGSSAPTTVLIAAGEKSVVVPHTLDGPAEMPPEGRVKLTLFDRDRELDRRTVTVKVQRPSGPRILSVRQSEPGPPAALVLQPGKECVLRVDLELPSQPQIDAGPPVWPKNAALRLELPESPVPLGPVGFEPSEEECCAWLRFRVPDALIPGPCPLRVVLLLDGKDIDRKSLTATVEPRRIDPPRPETPQLLPPAATTVPAGGSRQLRVSVDRRGSQQALMVSLQPPPGSGLLSATQPLPGGEETVTFDLEAVPKAGEGTYDVKVLLLADGKVVSAEQVRVSIERPAPMVERPAPSQDVKFTTADFVEIHGTYFPGPKGKKAPCVLLLHDLGKNRGEEGWSQLALALQKQGYAVLTFDFRGHGDSTTVNPGFGMFWDTAHNLKYRQQLLAGRPGAPNTIASSSFPAAYLPHLVNDIAAARLWLDQANDRGELNASQVLVIGAGEGASLGMIWLAAEAHRQEQGFGLGPRPGQPMPRLDSEIRTVAGAVWLSYDGRLGGQASPLVRGCAVHIGREKVAMASVFGQRDGRTPPTARARLLLLPIADTPEIGHGLLRDELGTEKEILQVMPKLLDLSEGLAWTDRRSLTRTTFWRFGTDSTAQMVLAQSGNRLLVVPVERLFTGR